MLDSTRGVLASLLWHSSACRGHSVLTRSPCPGNRGAMVQAAPKQRKIVRAREGAAAGGDGQSVWAALGGPLSEGVPEGWGDGVEAPGERDASLWWRLTPPLAPCPVGAAPSPAGVSQPLRAKALPQPALLFFPGGPCGGHS